MLHEKLISFGLSEKEAKIYIAALQIGYASVQKISIAAQVNRATTYAVIDRLLNEGIMSSFKEGKKFYFYAEHPEKALRILLNKQKTELVIKANNLSRVLPELKARSIRQGEAPFLCFYNGVEGIKEITKTIFRGRDTHYRILYNHELFYESFKQKDLQNLAYERLRKNIPAKVIRITKDKNQEAKNADQININPSLFNMNIDISLYDTMTRIISLKKPLSAISINNKNITKSLKNIFDILWEIMEKRAMDDEHNYKEIKNASE